MNGLETLHKLNQAQIALRNEASKTKVADVVEGYFVFLPHGYQVVYHTEDKLPTEGHPFLTIDFKGDDGHGPRFDLTNSEGVITRNCSLDAVTQVATSDFGLDGNEVAGRLGRLFAEISKN